MHQRRTKRTLGEASSDKINTYCIVLECIKFTYKNCLDLKTLVTIEARVMFKHEMIFISLGHLSARDKASLC